MFKHATKGNKLSVLADLIEKREAAQSEYDEFINPLIEAGDALTEEQETQRSELRGRITALDGRIDEVHADEQRNARIAKVRTEAGLDKPAEDRADGVGVDAAVTKEPTIYGEGSPFSYFADFVRAMGGLQWRGHRDAVRRLEQAEHEAAHEMAELERSGKKKDRRKARQIADRLLDEFRYKDPAPAQQAIRDFRAFGQTGWSQVKEDRGSARFVPTAEVVAARRPLLGEEVRTGMTTGGSSGGSFVTPVYFVEDYAPYRQFGRTFIDQCHHEPLPDYGISVNIPHLTGPAGVASQTEGSAVQETDPTAGYLTSTLTTEAGEVTVSQLVLDRAGPGFRFDVMVFDQLRRAYASVVDTFAINQALAGAGSVSYAGTVFNLVQASGATSFYTRVGLAKVNTITAAGTVLAPTHMFLQPSRWEEIEGWTDVNARPVVLPAKPDAGPWNAVAWGGDGNAVPEGFTNYKMRDLGIFKDGNIPAPVAGADQVITANMDEVWVFEGQPVPRVLPQTLASNLQVILQLYSYLTEIVRYPLVVQTISGTGMATPTY